MQNLKRPLVALTLAGLTVGLVMPTLADPLATDLSVEPVPISAAAPPVEAVPISVPILIAAPDENGWAGHWAQSDMQTLIDRGIITTRRALPPPNSALTVSDAAQLLIQLRDQAVPDGDAISAAVAVGLINPTDLELAEFGEDTQITREVFAVWLCRATGRQMLAEYAKWLLHPEFTDANQISPRFNNAVGLLQMHQIIAGYGDGSFAPRQVITVAEAYRMVSQAVAHPLEP